MIPKMRPKTLTPPFGSQPYNRDVRAITKPRSEANAEPTASRDESSLLNEARDTVLIADVAWLAGLGCGWRDAT